MVIVLKQEKKHYGIGVFEKDRGRRASTLV
jgi:hypothetical protein